MEYGALIQSLGTDDRVLCVTALAEGFHNPRRCSPGEITDLFISLRIEPPRLDGILARLRKQEFVMSPHRGAWSLTPRGLARAGELVAELSEGAVLAAAVGSPSGELADVAHHVIPPILAPQRWRQGINRLLADHPFDTNVFCMTRFPESSADESYLDPVKDVIEVARDVLASKGLTLHLASDRVIDDELFGNIAAHMWACRFGIALFEDRMERGLNYNLVIEVGAMLATGRRCALLKDPTIEHMPTDLVGHIYKDVAFDDLPVVEGCLESWIAQDLGIS